MGVVKIEWFQYLLIVALIFNLLAAFQFLQLWKGFKKVKVGDTLSNELVSQMRSKLKFTTILVVVGAVLGLIGVIFRSY